MLLYLKDILATILFARGWIIYKNEYSLKNIGIPERFIKEKINNYFSLLFDERNEFHKYREDEYVVFLIGYAIDINNTDQDITQILKNVLELYKKNNFNNDLYVDKINDLCGRWALFIIKEKDLTCFNDATGMKSIYYHEKFDIIASHYELINLYSNETREEIDIEKFRYEYGNRNRPQPWCLPGDLTPYQNIKILPANYYLQLPQHIISRFFPNYDIKESDIYSSAVYLGERLKNIMKKASEDYNLITSLTAGFDSRTTLSACKNIKNRLTYFTFINRDLSENSFAIADSINNNLIAKKISAHFGLRHFEIFIDKKIKFDYYDLLKKNHYHTHNPLVAYQLACANLINNKTLHVRSTSYEIIRRSYFTVLPTKNINNLAAQLANFSMYWPGIPNQSIIINYYKNYISKLKIPDVMEKGYNYGDLFYLEYRMTQWLGAICIESDPFIDIFTPMNARNLIYRGLTLPKEIKERNKLSELIIEYLWPELIQDFNYPNKIQPLNKFIDNNPYEIIGAVHLMDTLYDKINFKINGEIPSSQINFINSANNYFFECTQDSLIIGFAKNIINKGEDIYVDFKLSKTPGKTEFISFTITSIWRQYSTNNHIFYEIYFNDKLYYKLNTNEYSKPNQIIYIYKDDKSYIDIKIKIRSEHDSAPLYHNSIIKINNFISRIDHDYDIDLPYFHASEMDIRNLQINTH